jgi:protein TonB
MASTIPVPKVEVSELIVPDAPAGEREITSSAKPAAAPTPSTNVARKVRQRTPSTAAVAVVPQTLGTNDRRPARMHNNRPPRYPDIARQNRWEGTVLLKLSIDAKGRVTSVAVARSSGVRILDAEAVTAVRQWQGEPATRGGVAIASEEYLPVRFRL